MLRDIKSFLVILSSFSTYLPLITGLIRIKYLRGVMRDFFIFICVASLTEAALFFMATNGIHNLWLVNLFILYQFIAIHLIYRKNTQRTILQKAIIVIIICYIFAWIAFISYYGITNLEDNITTIGYLILTISSSIILLEKVNTTTTHIFRDGELMIALGFFIYSMFCVVIHGILHKFYNLDNDTFLIHYYDIIHSIVNISCNFIYAYALLCKYEKVKYYSVPL